MIKIADRLPDPEEDKRVLIYTEGYDFAGEQFFDVKAESLYPQVDEEGDDARPEVCQYASHWMPLPLP